MTFKLNGVEFPLQPTSYQWVDRPSKGFDGDGRPIYVAPRSFEMRWDLADVSGTYAVQQWYQEVSASGTVVVDLPKYQSADFEFYSYSGCVINEPSYGEYFNRHKTDVVLLVRGIRE